MMRLSIVLASVLVLLGSFASGVEVVVDDYEYDSIQYDITEDELIKWLEEMDYDISDNTKVQGVSDLLDLITSSNGIEPIVDYDYVIKDGDAEIVEKETENELEYPDIIYQDTISVEENIESEKETSVGDNLDKDTEVVWVPVAIEYDYEVAETGDLMELFDDEETELEYHQDETYQLFVQKAMDTSVKFQTLYQEQRIFNIILLSGVSLICLIVMFGMISLAVSIFNKSGSPNPTINDGNVKLVKTNGIVKSYAKIPVEVRNMLPSNVAYKELYEV